MGLIWSHSPKKTALAHIPEGRQLVNQTDHGQGNLFLCSLFFGTVDLHVYVSMDVSYLMQSIKWKIIGGKVRDSSIT